jgi:polar amino acid transport system substrate-binding protein
LQNKIITVILSLIIFLIISGCGNSKKPIASLHDAEHSKIGIMTGTTGEHLVSKRFPEAVIVSFNDIMDAIAALKSDRIDAAVTAYPTAMNVCKKNKDLVYLSEPLDTENTAIAIKKGNDKLLSEVNAVITELINNGTLKDMKRRWLKSDLSPYEEVKIKVPEKGVPLKIGVAATREPFCFMDAEKKVTGHDGELAHRVAAGLHRPAVFVDMKFSALITALQTGKIDLIITGMSATEERKKSVDFSISYFQNSMVLLVKKPAGNAGTANPGSMKFKTIEDIKDKKIGVLLDSVHDAYAMKNYPKADILQYKSPPELILAVKTGKIDAAVYTTETLSEILKTDKELKILGDTLFTIPIGMGFNKENGELRKKFNSFLNKIKGEGIYADMVDRWITKSSTEMPQIKNDETNGTLSVGMVSDKGLPFTIIKDNKLIGFDVELAERFASYLGKKFNVVDMDFGSLIVSAAAKKIDMIASTLMITEERKKQIDFSDPYLRLGASVFVLAKNFAENEGAKEPEVENSFWNGIVNSFHNNIIVEKRYLLIVDGLKTTAIISILSIFLGSILGSVVCFMRMSRRKMLLLPAKVFISLLRGTPVLVVLMIIFYVVFASINIDAVIVAVIAFGLNFAAYVSEMFRTGIEGVDKGQTEAGIAMGFSKIKTFIYIVLPQAARRILPVYKGEVISLVKMTSIVGYIAVQDLTKASDIIRSRTFDAFFPLIMVAVLYFLISWLLMVLLGYIERMTNPKIQLSKARLEK